MALAWAPFPTSSPSPRAHLVSHLKILPSPGGWNPWLPFPRCIPSLGLFPFLTSQKAAVFTKHLLCARHLVALKTSILQMRKLRSELEFAPRQTDGLTYILSQRAPANALKSALHESSLQQSGYLQC